MTLLIEGEVWYWRGPAPFYFLTVPETKAKEIKAVERHSTYGWGMIPVRATVGETEWTTSLWPKDGLYILPLKTAIRNAEWIEEGMYLSASIEVLMDNPLAGGGGK